MELCGDCKDNRCDDCEEQIDCKCKRADHSIAPCILVRDALQALNPDNAYINTADIVPHLAQGRSEGFTHMDILVNGNIFRVTLETIRCEKPDDIANKAPSIGDRQNGKST